MNTTPPSPKLAYAWEVLNKAKTAFTEEPNLKKWQAQTLTTLKETAQAVPLTPIAGKDHSLAKQIERGSYELIQTAAIFLKFSPRIVVSYWEALRDAYEKSLPVERHVQNLHNAITGVLRTPANMFGQTADHLKLPHAPNALLIHEELMEIEALQTFSANEIGWLRTEGHSHYAAWGIQLYELVDLFSQISKDIDLLHSTEGKLLPAPRISERLSESQATFDCLLSNLLDNFSIDPKLDSLGHLSNALLKCASLIDAEYAIEETSNFYKCSQEFDFALFNWAWNPISEKDESEYDDSWQHPRAELKKAALLQS